MPITEVFPNPIVKEVHFKVHFPRLFFIDKLVGDFQFRIMKEFPRSKEILRRQVLIADLGSEVKVEELPSIPSAEPIIRIWRFESETGVSVNLESGALGIHSTRHKTYANPEGNELFRDVVQNVIGSFLDIAHIPMFSRIGLRYVDECPLPEISDSLFSDYFNTTFPLDRYSVRDAESMQFFTVVRRGQYKLRFVEMLNINNNNLSVILDFDGFAQDIESSSYLSVTNDLHDMISQEFEHSIKAPVFEYMQRQKEE
jgi:uncharacterized protein (TIGR04255 family)